MLLPLEEAVNIQEALKPLGYRVCGFRDGFSHEFFGTVLYLRHIGAFSVKTDADVSSEADDVAAMQEPKNSL